ncbi:MAG TPA: RecQ family ATP-dependent DNA helicase [Chloroflexota bacterium]
MSLESHDQPERWPVRVRTGLVMLAVGEDGPPAGLAVLAALNPNGPDAASLTEHDLWARLTLECGDAQRALALTRTRQARRDSAPTRLISVEALLAAGDRAAAEADLAAMRPLGNQRSPGPLLAEGHLALQDLDWAAAEERFRAAEAILPSARGVLGLARALEGYGNLEEAAAVLADGARVSAGETAPELLAALAALRQTMGEPDAAAAALAAGDAALASLAHRLVAELAALRDGRGIRREPRQTASLAAPVPHRVPDSTWLIGATASLEDAAPELEQALFEHFGHARFRPGQAAVLRSLLVEEQDTLAVMPTGAGKSLCFQLPALLLDGLVLVISPLIALMADQLAGLDTVAALGDRSTAINSTLDGQELDHRLRGLAAGAFRLVYVAPERLRQVSLLRALRAAGVSLLVVDEAHCLSLWGHQFRPDYLAVGEAAALLGSPRILAVTATATPAMQEEVARTLGRPLRLVRTGVLRDNLFLEVRRLAGEGEKRQTLIAFARAARGSGIVYINNRDKCEQFAALLRRNGVLASHYHAGMGADERAETQQRFMTGKIRVLVATIAFGMGVNKRDIRFIVHYQPSQSLEAYVQEAGRAGRDGAPAHALLLSTPADKGLLSRHMHGDQVTLAGLRGLYGRARSAIRAAAGGPIDLSGLEDQDASPGKSEVAGRVGLSMLERAGYLSRGLDCPRAFSLQATEATADASDPRLADLVRRHDLGRDRSTTIPSVALAATLAVPVGEVEDILLDWHDAGRVRCRPGKRGACLRLIEPPPPEGSARLEAILATQEAVSEERIRALMRYSEATDCRNAVIARYFGEEVTGANGAGCGRCDRCVPEGRRTVEPVAADPGPRLHWDGPDLTPSQAILTLVATLPYAAGRSGLANILHGAATTPIGPDRCALHGYLRRMPVKAIIAEIDVLLQKGLLAQARAQKYPTVSLTERGRADLG